MKKFRNCMTHALDIEELDIPNSKLSLWYSSDPFQEILEKFDYEGRPEFYDYHFARQEPDGSWTERPSIYEEIQTVNIDTLISDYAKLEIQPLFLAIGKID